MRKLPQTTASKPTLTFEIQTPRARCRHQMSASSRDTNSNRADIPSKVSSGLHSPRVIARSCSEIHRNSRSQMMDGMADFGQSIAMNKSWKYLVVLEGLMRGCTFQQAARRSSLSRQAIWKRMKRDAAFSQEVTVAREEGRKLREYLIWVLHPFRGRRPPTGKGHGGLPRFRYGSFPR